MKITPCEKRRHAFFSLPAACRLFSRGVIFTSARVSLTLLSLRKNGDYLKSRLYLQINYSIPLKVLAILRFSNEIDYLKSHLILLKITQFEVVSCSSKCLNLNLSKANWKEKIKVTWGFRHLFCFCLFVFCYKMCVVVKVASESFLVDHHLPQMKRRNDTKL